VLIRDSLANGVFEILWLGFQHPGRTPTILVDALAREYLASTPFTRFAAYQVTVLAVLVGFAFRVAVFFGIVNNSALLTLKLVAGFIPNICQMFEQQFSFPERFKFTACGGITLVYLNCPRGKGIIHDWLIYEKPPAHCGCLFVAFDEFDRVQGYTFVGVPFRECYRSPFTVWGGEAYNREYRVCRSRLKERAYAELRAMTGKFDE
jgi:hypothetical protein